MPTLLISDANILIDLECCGLTEKFFALDFTLATADVIFEEEIEPYNTGFPKSGLQVMALAAESIQYIESLSNRGLPLPGVKDRFALALAREQDCILLTGDQTLRRLAEAEGVEVHGIIWVMEQLHATGSITIDDTAGAFNKLLDQGSWLPKAEIRRFLKQHGWQGDNFC